MCPHLIPSDNIPNRINDYFATIGPKLAESLGGNWVPTTDPKEANFEFNQVTLHDFVKIINEIDVSKSSAIDNVSPYVLKLTFQAISTAAKGCFWEMTPTGSITRYHLFFLIEDPMGYVESVVVEILIWSRI